MFIDTHHKGRNSDMLGTQPNILVFGAHAADYCFRSEVQFCVIWIMGHV